jgi:hypothetical protein
LSPLACEQRTSRRQLAAIARELVGDPFGRGIETTAWPRDGWSFVIVSARFEFPRSH